MSVLEQATGSEGTLLIRSTKTTPRVVDLRKDFLARLKGRKNSSKTGYIIELQGKPIKSLKRSLKSALKRAGIEKRVRLYDIRHMYGTYMAKNGADIFAIQSLMGHNSICTTRRYLHQGAQLKREAIERLPSLKKASGRQKGRGRVLHLVPKSSPQKKKEASTDSLTP